MQAVAGHVDRLMAGEQRHATPSHVIGDDGGEHVLRVLIGEGKRGAEILDADPPADGVGRYVLSPLGSADRRFCNSCTGVHHTHSC